MRWPCPRFTSVAAALWRSLRQFVFVPCMLALSALTVFAAGKTKAPPPETAPAETSYPVLDWLIVVVMVGLAVFVVCRTSRRT